MLPSGQDDDQGSLPPIPSSLSQSNRECASEPHLPVTPEMAFVAPPAPRLLLEDKIDEPSSYIEQAEQASTSKMDTG